jgi:hypothetical protein
MQTKRKGYKDPIESRLNKSQKKKIRSLSAGDIVTLSHTHYILQGYENILIANMTTLLSNESFSFSYKSFIFHNSWKAKNKLCLPVCYLTTCG